MGIIGMGARGVETIGKSIATLCRETGFRLNAVCDRNPLRMAEATGSLRGEFAKQNVDIAPTMHQDVTDLVSDPAVDLIMITSPTYCHRKHALIALQSGKKVYCDKPLAQNAEDCVAIVEAEAKEKNPIIMGFTRRYELPWLKAYSLLKKGAIGDLVTLQIRSIIPYSLYMTSWWRKREWSGGALNDKASHHFDVFNWFTESRAVRVNAFGGKSVVQVDPSAPARCCECNREACLYRRRKRKSTAQDILPHIGESWLKETEEKHQDDICVFAAGSDLYHNASTHFLYENGVIASHFYCIFGPDSEDQETLELVGTKGRILLIRHSAVLDIVSDYGKSHEKIDCKPSDFSESHFGADLELVRELRRFCDGAAPMVPARCGLEATRMVMAALKSMDSDGQTLEMKEIPDASL